MEAASPWEEHFSRPHGLESQKTVVFTVTKKIASDFIKIILLLSFMMHFDFVLCCMK